MKQKAKIGYPPEVANRGIVEEFQVIFDRPPTPAEVERFILRGRNNYARRKTSFIQE